MVKAVMRNVVQGTLRWLRMQRADMATVVRQASADRENEATRVTTMNWD